MPGNRNRKVEKKKKKNTAHQATFNSHIMPQVPVGVKSVALGSTSNPSHTRTPFLLPCQKFGDRLHSPLFISTFFFLSATWSQIISMFSANGNCAPEIWFWHIRDSTFYSMCIAAHYGDPLLPNTKLRNDHLNSDSTHEKPAVAWDGEP